MPAKATANTKTSDSQEKLAKKYQKKSAREHVLDNPDTYVGSIEKVDTTIHVFDDASNKVKEKTIEWIPGLYKLFDEGAVNARDHVVRMLQRKEAGETGCHSVTHIDFSVSDDGTIEITNDGNGIDVEKHPEHDVWIPEMIFGHLRTSTNYDKSEKKIVGGKNGFGFKLALIWSTWGRVETVDHTRKKKYIQEFHDNLTRIDAPYISRCTNKPYTKVSFKPDYARLGLPNGMSVDFVALLKRRVYDIAAVTDKNIKVRWNGELVPVKNFQQYIDLFIGAKDEAPRVYEADGERWEYAVALAPNDEFQQVSFVNGIFTSKGGKHVEHVVNQIVRKLTAYIKAKKKVDVKPAAIKEQLILFLRCDIENPAFDSQTKDFMNTPVTSFGSSCSVSDKFIEKVAKMGVMQAACAITEVKETKAAKKTDGTKSKNVRGIPKLLDANDAGTANSFQCELLLCEGDSAKAGVVSGLTQDDRKRIGVYPLRGKLFNVRGEPAKKISENKEIAEIKQILGLQTGKKYNSVDDIKASLRYGKVVFLTDQDLDGVHITALGINLFQSEWATLSKIPGFLSFMNTPILKATKGQQTKVFYNEGEYNAWKEANGESANGWKVKYYKGLGTSTGKEFREYFKAKKVVEFVAGEACDNQIDMVFNKKRADDRKDWLGTYDRESYLDTSNPQVSYTEFINRGLIHFSKYDCDRSIPNLMDGLKISLRKILFAAFKRNLTSEVKVAQFSGYVSEHSGYHHGEQSLNAAIVGLAQNYVGSNNINLFMPNGQFGTRLQGGKDSASERYIFTQLNPITRCIFPQVDDQVLSYLDDDGQQVEPIYYAPIIPMILVNGTTGIGTGFSTSIISYNPRQIIQRLINILETGDNGGVALEPYNEGFTGTIELQDDKYVITGKYDAIDATRVRITELPLGTWTDDYKEYLEKCIDGTVKGSKAGGEGAAASATYVKSYVDLSTDKTVDITVTFAKGAIQRLVGEEAQYGKCGLERLLKLYTTHSRNNMYLFDSNEKLVKFDTAEQIMDAFIPKRADMYAKRKAAQIDQLQKELQVLSNKAKFIQYNLDDRIDLRRKTDAQVTAILTQHKFDLKEGSYNYLRKMPMDTVTEEKANALLRERDDKSEELEKLERTTEKQIWISELKKLQTEYESHVKVRSGQSSTGDEANVSKPKARKNLKVVTK
jgi:DNA topoisomerase-2